MKNIDEFIVWTSVKLANIWFIGSIIFLILFIVGEKKGQISLKVFLCVLIWIVLITYINSRKDDLYKQFWSGDTEDIDKLYDIRGKSVWLPSFIGTILLFLIK